MNHVRHWILSAFISGLPFVALAGHDTAFWKQIRATKSAVPPNESLDKLALELIDLTGNTDPILRDQCGYEIFVIWIYRDHRLNGNQLEQLRKKLLSGMIFQLGHAEDDSVFRRSFSALYMSVLAAEDLQKSFLSADAFHETLAAALQCYANEKDLRGYVPQKGWAHATAHVGDLLKFLARNPQLSLEDQKRIVIGVSQRCRTAPSVFTWGEDARIAAALLSIVDRKDFNPSIFDGWFQGLIAEHKELWKGPNIDTAAYISVRIQTNVLAHLAAKIAAQKPEEVPKPFRDALSAILAQID